MTRGEGRKNAKAGVFGAVNKLPSGRYRARYNGPDGRRYNAPTTFTTVEDARAWLSLRQADIIRKAWEPPEAKPKTDAKVTFKDYADVWLERRTVKGRPLKARTREHYRKLLDQRLFPTFGSMPIGSITSEDVQAWHAAEGKRVVPGKLGKNGKPTKGRVGTPTYTAHAYSLLNTVMKDAMKDSRHLVTHNPCVISGAGYATRKKKIVPATLDELATIVGEMPERYRVMVLLAAWCALRFGELTALTRNDIELSAPDDADAWGVVHVRSGVVLADGVRQRTTPKSEAGERDVEIPPHLVPLIREHLDEFAEDGAEGLLFPATNGGFLAQGTVARHFSKARGKANRPDLRFHDLRHSGAVFAAATGATLAELMNRLGHSTPAAALRYQHATQSGDRRIAGMLSKLAGV